MSSLFLLDIAEKLAALADTLSDTLSLPRRAHERPLRVAIIRCAFSKHYPPENYVIGHYRIA
jgi:hypothetical protein